MPPVAVESGFISRIVSHREVMISLGCLMLVLLTLLLGRGSAAVLLLNTKNESRSFPDMEAAFGTFTTLFLSLSLPITIIIVYMNTKVHAFTFDIAMMGTLIFEWYVVRRGSKNGYPKDIMCF